jgi:hypothetical protein
MLNHFLLNDKIVPEPIENIFDGFFLTDISVVRGENPYPGPPLTEHRRFDHSTFQMAAALQGFFPADRMATIEITAVDIANDGRWPENIGEIIIICTLVSICHSQLPDVQTENDIRMIKTGRYIPLRKPPIPGIKIRMPVNRYFFPRQPQPIRLDIILL